MSRDEKIQKAKEMRAEGRPFREIAAELGVATSTANKWFTDPHSLKQKARRVRYQGTCKICGGHTTGSEGRNKAPEMCWGCFAGAPRLWSEDAIVAAIRRFVGRYGRKPNATDFNPSRARNIGHRWRAERFYADGDYPHATTVREVFGRWNAAIVAAGLDSWGVGSYPRTGRHLVPDRTSGVAA